MHQAATTQPFVGQPSTGETHLAGGGWGARVDAAHPLPAPVSVWGLKLTPLTLAGTLEEIDRRIAEGTPSYFVTANLNYAMLSERDVDLQAVNAGAAFVLADGMPLVWASRLKRRRLPERVAGSDLVPAIFARAAEKGHRAFLLGGGRGVGQEVARRMQQQHPGLVIAGVESPVLCELTEADLNSLLGRIQAAKADILLAALGQPQGELWIARHLHRLKIQVCVQIGASLDFVAGRFPRAPGWMQASGLEWLFRLGREPRRLAGRYWKNATFLVRALARDVLGR